MAIIPTALPLLRSAAVARTAAAAAAAALPVRPLVRATAGRPMPNFTSSTRLYSTEAESKRPRTDASEGAETGPEGVKGEKKGFLKVSWIFGSLAGLGALVTIYGLLEFYSTLTTWPKAIRKPLRAALKSKLNGDYARSEKFFREAIDVALEMGPSALDSDPLLKVTGIYVELVAVLELMGQRVTAFTELRKALEMYGAEPIRAPVGSVAGGWAGDGYKTSDKDRIRVIGMYQKLGQLSLEISSSSKAPSYTAGVYPVEVSPKQTVDNWNQAAEYYLSSALTAMLQLGLSRPAPSSGSGAGAGAGGQVVLGRDVDLPDAPPYEETEGGRVDKRGLGMTMESLSEVYARKGQYDLAAQLLLQAVSLLLPPQSQNTPPVRDRCQAAMLMTTISSHALRARSQTPPSNSTPAAGNPQAPAAPAQAQAIKIARSWSLRSLQLSEAALNESDPADKDKDSTAAAAEAAFAVCQRARSVGLHNLGMLAEMEGDLPSALNMFNKALSAARETGFVEGKREAQAAIRRVQNLSARAGP